MTIPADTFDQTPDAEPMHWESFYKNYRKPGYIAGYEIVHKLGGGVFGVVFKARKESIGKPYAIKFLKIDDPSVKAQVLHELDQVSLFAQVDHPNLVSIEDRGMVDGIPYIIMGYAGEETLKSRLEESRLSEEDALRIFVQIARGVQALHDHSLIHFDLKPANVFLRGDIARVGDYGLSKLVCESRMSLSFGRGTPYYMAPEMLQRRGDHRSDIYSLGVILYECLTGDVPFKGDSEWEVLKGHEQRPVPWPESLPASHRAILERMLAKEPGDRFQSVDHVLQSLRAPGRLGESIILDLGPSHAGPRSGNRRDATQRDATQRGVMPTIGTAVPSAADVSRPDQRPRSVLGSLFRILVLGLLLPARVLGIGLGRGLQVAARLPVFLFRWIGRASLVLIAGILVLLLSLFVVTLVT
ncbi:MAG: serine/threonine protein kinase [Planctomycetes bacterium]|nr:serine/threonine protein kinase [Planctomycetota bacterium]